jgi:hypothetical protein
MSVRAPLLKHIRPTGPLTVNSYLSLKKMVRPIIKPVPTDQYFRTYKANVSGRKLPLVAQTNNWHTHGAIWHTLGCWI